MLQQNADLFREELHSWENNGNCFPEFTTLTPEVRVAERIPTTHLLLHLTSRFSNYVG